MPPVRLNFAQALDLALDHHRAGRLDPAEALYRSLLEAAPDNANVLHLLGVLSGQRGRDAAAVELIRRALARHPDFPEAHHSLGREYLRQGRPTEAIAALRTAVGLRPELAPAHHDLGVAALSAGDLPLAIGSLDRAAALQPDAALTWASLSQALRLEGRPTAAHAAAERAVALDPALAGAWGNLGNALKDVGRIGEAVAAYRRALILEPGNTVVRSALLLALHYDPAATPAALLAAHHDWGRRYGGSPRNGSGRPRTSARRRLGYVSADFGQHPVGGFLHPVLAHHDHGAFEIFCYSDRVVEDALTDELRRHADHWRRVAGKPDAEVAEQIRADGIDILVDLAGHTAGHRLAVFASRPAPVQVTWLGYPDTTGMDAIDHRLTDEIADPSGLTDPFARETLVRLPHGFLCYAPMTAAPEVAPAPALGAGHVTFGSLNNVAKVTPEVAAVWAEILHRVPGSRLLLKSRQLTEPAVRELYRARFAAHGIAGERLELIGWTPSPADHLALYHRIDIALDPFPYNGTTTTCDALWMGVPVVSWAWDRHAGRVGASLLNRVGLSELVAPGRAAYVGLAVELAQDPARLAALHTELRPRMAASPLCDAPGFVRSLEAAYRRMRP